MPLALLVHRLVIASLLPRSASAHPEFQCWKVTRRRCEQGFDFIGGPPR